VIPENDDSYWAAVHLNIRQARQMSSPNTLAFAAVGATHFCKVVEETQFLA